MCVCSQVIICLALSRQITENRERIAKPRELDRRKGLGLKVFGSYLVASCDQSLAEARARAHGHFVDLGHHKITLDWQTDHWPLRMAERVSKRATRGGER